MEEMKKRRLAMGISQRELGKRAKLTEGHVCKIESGYVTPRKDTARRINEVLDGKVATERIKVPFKDAEEQVTLKRVWDRDWAPLPDRLK